MPRAGLQGEPPIEFFEQPSPVQGKPRRRVAGNVCRPPAVVIQPVFVG
jgi:hypothetical protein